MIKSKKESTSKDCLVLILRKKAPFRQMTKHLCNLIHKTPAYLHLGNKSDTSSTALQPPQREIEKS
jgi:hypothetical protein